MGLKRATLVLYILFLFNLNHKFTCVVSRSTNQEETLPFTASKLHVEGNSRELAAVFIERVLRGGGGGRGGGGRSSSSGGGRGGGSMSRGSISRPRGRAVVVPVYTAGGSHGSSGSHNLSVTMCTVGLLALSVLTGLFLAY
ncbi:unnamed protein product [Cochlearia groenlandica]